jgi:hypothetical protein
MAMPPPAGQVSNAARDAYGAAAQGVKIEKLKSPMKFRKKA